MTRHTDETKNIDKIAGDRVKEARIFRGMSREQLANKIGVTHQQLGKYENASNRITIGRLALISKALNEPVEYFVQCDPLIIPPDHERLCIEVARNFTKIKDRKTRIAVSNLIKDMT